MILLLLLLLDGLVTTVTATCTVLPVIPHAKPVKWIKKGDAYPGILTCSDGYALKEGLDAIVWCKQGIWTIGNEEKLANACVVDSNSTAGTELIYFRGEWYNYTFIKMPSKTLTFPLIDPSLSYVFVTNYTANNATPTIRVRVGLVGKASNPVLVNIQQSTESVGFELPLRVVGKGGSELAVNYSDTIRELCTRRNTAAPARQETVRITVTSTTAPHIHFPNDNLTDLMIHVRMSVAQNTLVPLNKVVKAKFQPNEDQWFYFSWEDQPKNVHFVVLNVTSNNRKCATVTVRNSSCTLNKESINEIDHGMFLTMTTRSAIIIPRAKYPEVFFVSIFAEVDDTPCGLPGNLSGRSRLKTIEFNIHEHHQSTGFLFLPLVIIPICAILLVFGSIYIKYNDRNRTSSQTEQARATTMESLEASTNTGRRHTESLDDDLIPMTICTLELPNTRVDFIPIVMALIVLPVFCDVLSDRVEAYTKFGQLDKCQFNIECSFPAGIISDIGRSVTCFGYIFTGLTLLFLIFTHHRKTSIYRLQEMITGIQHDYEMLRAISYCIILQGVIGFIYHMCPNESTESLSNLFFLLAVAFTFQKIYQNRHPDIRRILFYPVYITALCLGLHGVLNVTVHTESQASWILFGIFHSLLTIFVPLQYILLDTVTFCIHPFLIYKNLPTLRAKLSKLCSTQVMFGVATMVLNVTILSISLALQPTNFMLYLIPVFVYNMLMYLMFYIAMKTGHHKEEIGVLHVLVITAVWIMWISASYYLVFHTSISPGVAPAVSREGSKPCLVLEMFDGHDLWHILSAVALFLTNFLVLIIDDSQAYTQTSQLAVF